MTRFRLMPMLVVAAVLLGIFIACATEPLTGRRQFIAISADEEARMGVAAFDEVLASSKMSTNSNWKARVDAIGRRILAAVEPESGLAQLDWRFEVIADSQLNAFALPGGKVAFYEGILPVCDTDDGIAVVMGHEIAHVYARHGAERVSQTMAANGGLQAAQIIGTMLGTEENAQVRDLAITAIGAGVKYGVLLPFSREHESAADHIGLLLMARAGYDPREAVRFWGRMATASGSGGGGAPEWMSTHPSHDTRIQRLEALMPEALALYEQSRR